MNPLTCFLKGYRTLLACLAFIVTGLVGVLGAVDLTPIVALLVKDPELLPAAMVAIGILFGLLRYFSTTPMFQAEPARHDAVDEADEDRVKTDEGK